MLRKLHPPDEALAQFAEYQVGDSDTSAAIELRAVFKLWDEILEDDPLARDKLHFMDLPSLYLWHRATLDK